MSTQLIPASEPDGNHASLQGTKVGGSKPLHRFIRGSPKATGIVILVIGTSFVILSLTFMIEDDERLLWAGVPSGFYVGTLFITLGILYIVTGHNTTKRTVTMSLALGIVSIMITCWSVMQIAPTIAARHDQFIYRHETIYDNTTEIESTFWEPYEAIGFTVEMIILFYSFVGAIIIAVMSCLAGSSLRSTLTQAIVVMTTTPAEKPVE